MDLSELYSLQFLMLAELAVGYLLRKIKFISSDAGKTLSKLVVNVFLPCETVVAFATKVDASTFFKATLKKVLTHPCIISVELGVILMLSGLTLPTAITDTLTSLGNAVMPLTMIFLGITLADSGFHDMISKTSVYYSVIRLLLIPLAVMAACYICKVESTAAAVSVILAAMPMGSSAALLKAQMEFGELQEKRREKKDAHDAKHLEAYIDSQIEHALRCHAYASVLIEDVLSSDIPQRRLSCWIDSRFSIR